MVKNGFLEVESITEPTVDENGKRYACYVRLVLASLLHQSLPSPSRREPCPRSTHTLSFFLFVCDIYYLSLPSTELKLRLLSSATDLALT